MLLPSGNPFKCHEEVLYFQLLIPPKRFDIFSPRLGGSEGLGAFRLFFRHQKKSEKKQKKTWYIVIIYCYIGCEDNIDEYIGFVFIFTAQPWYSYFGNYNNSLR